MMEMTEEEKSGGGLAELTGEPGNLQLLGTHDLERSQAAYTL